MPSSLVLWWGPDPSTVGRLLQGLDGNWFSCGMNGFYDGLTLLQGY